MINIDQVLNAKPILTNQKIHVFFFQLSLFCSKNLFPYLSEDELVRAHKLKVAQRQQQFVIARGLLRILLSNSLGKEPPEIIFSYEQHCKPVIKDKVNNQLVEFNISHSGDYILIAITLDNKVGVDIEKIDPRIDYQSLANRFFSDIENQALINMDKDKQLACFYCIWVRKESFIKATGKGVAFGLERFSVPLTTNNDAGAKVNTSMPLDHDWFCYNLTRLNNYKAALTTCRQDCDIIIYK